MQSNNLPGKVLIVDDDPAIAQQLEKPLEGYNIRIVKATDFDSALYLFNQQRFEVVIIELEFEPVSGLVLAQKFRANENKDRASVGIIISSGKQRTNADAALLRELGDLEFINKPMKAVQLLPYLTRALERFHLGQKYDDIKQLAYNVINKTGKIDAALRQVDEGLDSRFTKQKLMLQSELLEHTESYDDALSKIQPLLDKDPEDIALLNLRGRILMKAGRLEEAKDSLEKADKLAPQNIDRVQNLARTYLDLREPDKSKEKMKELIDLNPELQDLKFDLFSDLESAGFQEHAISLCKDTTKPMEVVRFYNNKGVLLSKDGSTEDALREYYTALMYYPKFKENYRILFNIALSEAKKKNKEGFLAAEQALEKCLALKPDFEKAKGLLEQIRRTLKPAS